MDAPDDQVHGLILPSVVLLVELGLDLHLVHLGDHLGVLLLLGEVLVLEDLLPVVLGVLGLRELFQVVGVPLDLRRVPPAVENLVLLLSLLQSEECLPPDLPLPLLSPSFLLAVLPACMAVFLTLFTLYLTQLL